MNRLMIALPSWSMALGLLASHLYAEETKAPPAQKASPEAAKSEDSKPEISQFIRVQRNERKLPISMDTAIVRYVLQGAAPAVAAVQGQVNLVTEDGRTPLHMAAAKGHTEVVKLLLAKGAQPDVKAKDGSTPLHLAAEGGFKDIVELLLTAQKAAPAPAAAGAPSGITVDLIGAVHIGDKLYYQTLNKVFQEYDALLYELVAPPNARPKGGTNPSNPLAWLQNGMGSALELDYQLTHIDYHQKNFVHADMTPEEFSKSMSDRGEGFMQMFLKSMGQGIAQQNNPGTMKDTDLFAALFAPDRALRLKRIMAEQFENLDSQMAVFGGPEGSTLITERNKKALEVLSAQLKAGKKKIGIFYGAGHMADMEERLSKDFQLRPSETRWITAWDLNPKKK